MNLLIWRVMKLSFLLMTAALLQVSARGLSQEVTLSLDNAPIQKVFREIEKQTGYGFLYTKKMLEDIPAVSIHVEKANLEDVLKQCFSGKGLDYSFENKTIVIRKKENASPTISSTPFVPPVDVHGRVTDSLGNPLAGASITVKGTKNGVQSDANGMFTLKLVDAKSTLIISFTGFESKEYKMNGQDGIAISLSRSTSQLDQIQVIAYGTQTQRFSVGNVTTVSGEDIQKQPVTNPLLALEGRVPGLFITQSSGIPGSYVKVQIQGQNSIANGNDPFYVIDGVPYYSQLPSTGWDNIFGGTQLPGTGGGTAGSPFSYISPSEIETITILKDADATAIYGSQAANGAILITTRKGKAGKTRVDINLQQGFGHITHELSMLNTQQYLAMRREAFKNDGLPLPSILTSPNNSNYDINGFWDTTRYTDWQKTLIGGTAQYTNINATISGGTTNIQYLIGGNYNRQTTVFPGDFSDKGGSVRVNLNGNSASRKFYFQFSGYYSFDNNQLPAYDLTVYAVELAPDAPALYNKDGSLNWAQTKEGVSSWNNPLNNTLQNYNNKTWNLVSNLVLGYHFLGGLDFKCNFGYTNMQTSDFFGLPLIVVRPERRQFAQSGAGYGTRNLNSWITEPQITFNSGIAKGKLNLLIGTTIKENNSSVQSIEGLGYASDLELENIQAATTIIAANSSTSQYKYNAIFSRLNYNWEDKYVLDASVRRDGSSRFGSANQFHNFWSIGGAWIFSEESLFKHDGLFSFGKLRASYGTSGSDQIGDYSFLSLYYPALSPGIPYQNATGLLIGGLSNPYLQWEQTNKLQFGMDIGVFKNRILLGITYQQNRSSNQLLGYSLPSFVGFGTIAKNFPATVQNSDMEFTLATINVKSQNFRWTTNLNLTIPRNKLISFPGLAQSPYADVLEIGQPLGIQRIFDFLGVDPASGKYLFLGSDGKPTTAPTFSNSLSFYGDRTVVVNPSFPNFYGGVQNNLSYKGFEIDFLFQYVDAYGKNFSFYNGSTYPGQFRSSLGNQPLTVLNEWKKPGDISSIAKFSTFSQLNVGGSNYGQSNHYGAFARLKNLSVAYELPAKWKLKARMESCSVYFQAQNLLTITRYKGLDPETQNVNATLPPLRVLTFGIRATF